MKRMELIYQLEKLYEAYFQTIKVDEARCYKEPELKQARLELIKAIAKIKKELSNA